MVYREIKQALIDMDRMFGLLSEHREIEDRPDAVDVPPGPATVDFREVDFAYEPARTRFERPVRMLAIAESSACMPEAQLRITVQPGTFCPQPMRSATTRPMLTSSTEGAAQPRMTSSRSCGENGWRMSSVRPAWVASYNFV